MYHVYQLLTPSTNQPFYIGKGTGTEIKRLSDHISESLKPVEEQTNQLKCAAIETIIAETGYVPFSIELFDVEDDAFSRERELISQHGRIIDGSGILANIAKGGRGGHHKGKPVYQFDLNGNIICEYRSMSDAARHHNVTTSALWKVFNDSSQNTQCAGFIWSKTSELSQKAIDAVRNRKKQPRVIYSVDVDGNWTMHDTISGASRFHEIYPQSIRSALLDPHAMAVGLHWTDSDSITFPVIEERKDGVLIARYDNTADAARKLQGSKSAIGRAVKGTLKSYRGSQFSPVTVTYNR